MSMSINCFLAMTAGEFASCAQLPTHPAWMACHFSAYGTGLTNLPRNLPAGSMVIVNDRIPLNGHDPKRIGEQLADLEQKLDISGFLLDFQRKDVPEAEEIATHLVETLTAPVGVAEGYCQDLTCPVFVTPPSLHIPPAERFSRWNGRELWLEAAIEAGTLRVTSDGCHYQALPYTPPDSPVFAARELFSKYRSGVTSADAIFTFYRGPAELKLLMEHGKALGITRAIGLYQQLGNSKDESPEV